ncbi:Nitrogen permease regulator 3 [Erysiphe necator]|nr:Nitrogen permease regulator 3 [Erysiphe necator]
MNTSGLVAMALTIRSNDGPRFIFHYPARPRKGKCEGDILYGTDMNFNKLEAEDDKNDKNEVDRIEFDFDDDDDDEKMLHSFNRISLSQEDSSAGVIDGNPLNHHIILDEKMHLDEHYDTPNGIHVVPWEYLFQFSTTDLENILTPSRAYRKSRFELTLDSLCFLSYPIHIREDGTWTRRKRKQKLKGGNSKAESLSSTTDKEKGIRKIYDDSNLSEEYYEGGMTMFNVVFILDVPRYDMKQKVDEMFDHVVKKFNLALMEAQASSGYVWFESELILAIKEKAREDRRPMSWLWREILLLSTLASAIRDIFHSISHNKIATVKLGSGLDLSLQIPVPSFLISLPTSKERAMIGLLATNAIPFVNEDGDYGQPQLNKHFALLLLENETKLVAELQADKKELSAALIECISLCKPTLSFAQTAQINSIELTSLLTLASHLIVYRRAIAIPPLHSQNVYIVSPNCDLRMLPEASLLWKKTFPFAPSLQSFLAALSASPRPYRTLVPSRDHRPTYMEMLAWLIRGGWVTQLRTFTWIQVWPEIQYEVDYKLRAEVIKNMSCDQSKPQDQDGTESSDSSTSNESLDDYFKAPLTAEQVAEKTRLQRLAAKRIEQLAEEYASFSKLPAPVATLKPSINFSAHLKAFPTPYIIKDPGKLSYTESLYVSAIRKRFTKTRAKNLWLRFIKYFNGVEALESIALRENMTHKETWHILLEYQEHLLVCRYW